jgi:hypothetical protein
MKNLAWFAIRRYSILFDKKAYEDVLKQGGQMKF